VNADGAPAAGASAVDALVDVLRSRDGCGALRLAAPAEPLKGGFWADIIALRFADAPPELSGDLILRVMPAHERASRDAVVQRAVGAAGFPTPRVAAAGVIPSSGRPFILMERARGGTLLAGLAVRDIAIAFHRMPRLLAEATTALHRLDPESLARALGEAGWPRESVGTGQVLDDIAASSASGLAGFGAALARLVRTRPSEDRLAICHGDMQPLNLIVEGGALSAVIDWTNARIADPTYDVAYTAQLLEQAPIALPRALQPLRRRFGRRSARQFLAAHEAIAPIDRARLPWYDALHALRLVSRVAERRATRDPLPRSHPWELAVDDALARVARQTGAAIALPPYPGA